jgi:hypothetical protein
MAATGQHLRAAASAQEAFFEAAMYALVCRGGRPTGSTPGSR